MSVDFVVVVVVVVVVFAYLVAFFTATVPFIVP